jgi:predicted acetyltransferase
VSTPFDIGPPRDERELEQFGKIASEAFVVAPERFRPYFDAAGRGNFRFVRRDGALVGGLAILPKGQWFGGQAVPMAGIAVVAVPPEHRAGGVATELLSAVLRELYDGGCSLSTLYPATVALYRRAGYELAGVSCEVTLTAKSIDLRDRTLAVRAATPDDEPQIRAVYRQAAARTAGNLDRSEFNWWRVREQRGEKTQAYVVCRGPTVEGYAYLLSQSVDMAHANLRVLDMAAVTPEAARRVLTLIADYRTIRDQVIFRSGPFDPLLMHLAEVPATAVGRTPWMTRIVHVPRALAARGYPAGVAAELHLDVRDEVLAENNGRWVLHVADGHGEVHPGGRGTLAVHVRGLAALYTGFLTPAELVLAGLASGPAPDLAAAAAPFAGPTPWMRDAF